MTERWLTVSVSLMRAQSVFQLLTFSVKMPITGLWSLILYSMLLVYRSCLIFRGYSSSSSTCMTFFASTVFSSCSWAVEVLCLRRHRILSVQAGLRFFPLDRKLQISNRQRAEALVRRQRLVFIAGSALLWATWEVDEKAGNKTEIIKLHKVETITLVYMTYQVKWQGSSK